MCVCSVQCLFEAAFLMSTLVSNWHTHLYKIRGGKNAIKVSCMHTICMGVHFMFCFGWPLLFSF